MWIPAYVCVYACTVFDSCIIESQFFVQTSCTIIVSLHASMDHFDFLTNFYFFCSAYLFVVAFVYFSFLGF